MVKLKRCLVGDSMNRAIFLDRDGVIVKDKGYIHKIEDMEIIEGAADAVKAFNNAGFKVIVVSNQAGIARGYYKEDDTVEFNKAMLDKLEKAGAQIDAVYFCPHHPTEGKVEKYSKVCECRKPAPGMILQAAKEHEIDLRYSWMIGDRQSDIEAGKKAGCKTIFIGEDKGVKNLKEAAGIILHRDKIKSRYGIEETCKKLKAARKKIVFTNGCFDLLHPGHVHYLQEAKKLGDVLIVGINSDASVKKIKGKMRPINSGFERAYVLAGLQCVDYVTIFEEDTPIELLKVVNPTVHVKGGDWESKPIPERETVERNGGKVVFIKFLDGYSTTSLIEKIRKLK